MTDSKEKVGSVKEVINVPLSSVGETVGKLVTLVAKINDISDAEKAMLVAKKAYKDGKVDEAKSLITDIFKRLQDVGKAPEGLDVGTIQNKILVGEQDKLSILLKTQSEGEGTKADPEIKGMVRKTPDLFKQDKTVSERAKSKLNQEISDKQPEVKKREARLLTEIMDLARKMEFDKKYISEKKLLSDMQQLIKDGWVGTAPVQDQIKAFKNQIKTLLAPDGVVNKREIEALISAKKRRKNKIGYVVGVVDGMAGDRIELHNLSLIVSGLNKVEEAAAKGLDLSEAIRMVHQDEIREIRKFLYSAKTDANPNSDNYNPVYAELVQKLDKKFGDKERAAALRLSIAIDLQYTEVESNKGVNLTQLREMRQRAENGQFADLPLGFDENGNPIPVNGVEFMGGAANHQRLEQLYTLGEREFFRDFEEVPGGGYRARNYDELYAQAKARAEANARERKLAAMSHRETFVNVDMQALKAYMKKYDEEHPSNTYKISEMIDEDYYEDYSVTKLKEEVMRDEAKRKFFEKWWIQEKLHQTRLLAYEGQFEKRQGSTRMIRFNSLDEIVGVSTSVKGFASWMAMSFNVIDQQNNAYVNQELMGKLNSFWTNQGVDFRLDNMLKMFREEICLFDTRGEKGKKVGDVSMFDGITFMQQDIVDPVIRKELGIPDWRDIKWGTMIYKYSAMDKRDKVREIAWKYFAKTELGIDWDNNAVVPKDQRGRIMGMYQNIFDLSFNFASSHKLLNTMIGDASFTQGKVELPGAAAEMHLKLDPVLYPRLFAPRFNWLNAGFKELWFLFDPGVRDYVTMAPQDYAGQYVTFDTKKYLQWRNESDPVKKAQLKEELTRGGLESENGSWTIMSGMLGGYDKRKASTLSDQHIEAAADLQNVFDNALWHWGAVDPHHHGGGGHHGKETDIMMELGVVGEKSTAFRRSVPKIRKRLLSKPPTDATLRLIDWKKYCDIVQNPRIEQYLMGRHSPQEKWAFFANTFGEGSFDHTTSSTKRPGDHTMKYGFENFNKYVEVFMKFLQNPYSKANDDALNEVPKAVNAPAMAPLAKKRFTQMKLLSEKIGRSITVAGIKIGGGESWRLKRDPKTNQTEFDTSKGIGEDGDNQLPAYKVEAIRNDRGLFDEIKNKSMADSVGFGTPQDPNYWIDYAKGLYAEGILSENDFEKFHKDILNGVWWEPKLNFYQNMWRYRKLEPVLEWLAPQLGITAHELEHILEENTEKTVEKFWHYLNGGGGGHH